MYKIWQELYQKPYHNELNTVIFESDGSSTEDEEIVDNLQILEILKFRLAVVCQKEILTIV